MLRGAREIRLEPVAVEGNGCCDVEEGARPREVKLVSQLPEVNKGTLTKAIERRRYFMKWQP